MNIMDFSDGHTGFCCTTELDGKEFILSQCFELGTYGVGEAIRKIMKEIAEIPTIGLRHSMILRGIDIEQRGMRLTNKAPACSAIVKREYGVRKGLSKKKTGEAFHVCLSLAHMALKEGFSHSTL